ncbi:MAG: hypothetical protein JXQ27_17605 [Acidobacteria bacterium]|nr:hypothetical protein [Acidobacteriota bacterium]
MPDAYIKPTIEVWRESRRRHILPIEGRSMTPLLRQGDRVTISWVEPARLRPGDIIAYWNESRFVVHRLLEIKKEHGKTFLRESGDQGGACRWIHADRLLGRVESVLKPQGTIVLMRTRWRLPGRLLASLLRFETWARSGRGNPSREGSFGDARQRVPRFLGRLARIPSRIIHRSLGGRL